MSILFLGFMIFSNLIFAKQSPVPLQTIRTNEVTFYRAPSWLKKRRLNQVIHRVSRYFEWDVRRVPVQMYESPVEMQRVHHLKFPVMAVTIRNPLGIHLGQGVNNQNFDQVFGHELGHVILIQKYKRAIPAWLEEGLVNHAVHRGKVDYSFLKNELKTRPITWNHPAFAKSPEEARFLYQLSLALAELLDRRCDLPDLLQLSVGKKLEIYLKNTCEIDDLDVAVRKWIAQKSRNSG
ncbi:MAG: hypothetical protein CL678_03910 [Bdellovibrionaceae bacterium]|nr:hypothetical protein [Pseudobdellovibrionaceae bacterium]